MMKCKVCGNFDESNTAYCIKCGRSPHELVKTEVEIAKEKLAELEHQQWIFWSKDIYSKEVISKERADRWKELWKPYNQLTEDEKETDRIWAKKVLIIFNETHKQTCERFLEFLENHIGSKRLYPDVPEDIANKIRELKKTIKVYERGENEKMS